MEYNDHLTSAMVQEHGTLGFLMAILVVLVSLRTIGNTSCLRRLKNFDALMSVLLLKRAL